MISGAVAPVGLPAGETTGPVAAAPTREATQGPSPEDIARWVREAGWSGLYTEWSEPTGDARWDPVKSQLTVPVTTEQIERFAALAYAAGTAFGVKRAAHLMREMSPGLQGALAEAYMNGAAAGAAAEREACAKVAEDMCEYGKPYSAAAAIRSRGEI